MDLDRIAPATVRILVLNPGSATLKATVLDLPDLAPRFDRTIDWMGEDGADHHARTVDAVVRDLTTAGIAPGTIDAVGYRVVHGGTRFIDAVALDDAAVDAIDALRDLAPLHNPIAAATIRAARDALPGIPHVAAFDTAFHAHLSETARRYPVPDEWVTEAGIRRYGFHGLSVAWSTTRAAELLDRPVDTLGLVVTHLGGGCSVTAVAGGRSVDTSMGMTPLEGLMMGTRAGSIDPGIVFRLLRLGHGAADIESDLDRRSGLLGVGGTPDMARLLAAAAEGDARAALAIALFVRRAAAGIAAAATTLPRLDAIVFTGGIGEHAGSVRAAICDRLAVLGVPALPPAQAGDPGGDVILASRDGRAVLRIAAREDVVIARSVATVLGVAPA